MLTGNQYYTRVLLICSVGLFAIPSIESIDDDPIVPFTTYLEKTIAEADVTDSSSFTIPHGQCSGFINKHLLCGTVPAGSVRVVVKDLANFASIRIDNGLQSARVVRERDSSGRCAGRADVDVSVGCLHQHDPALQDDPALQGGRRIIRSLPDSISQPDTID